jgi:hypothetical protein
MPKLADSWASLLLFRKLSGHTGVRARVFALPKGVTRYSSGLGGRAKRESRHRRRSHSFLGRNYFPRAFFLLFVFYFPSPPVLTAAALCTQNACMHSWAGPSKQLSYVGLSVFSTTANLSRQTDKNTQTLQFNCCYYSYCYHHSIHGSFFFSLSFLSFCLSFPVPSVELSPSSPPRCSQIIWDHPPRYNIFSFVT